MRNLAGKPIEDSDKQIIYELSRCGLSAVPIDCGNSEVQTHYGGILLHNTRFRRAWTYWMVDCRVPLHIAKRMYEHPVGRTDIRVCGHCGCPPPEAPWIEWRDPDTNKKYARLRDKEQIQTLEEVDNGEFAAKFRREHIFHNDPASVGAEGTIDSYHIDSELGLYVFVQFLTGKI